MTKGRCVMRIKRHNRIVKTVICKHTMYGVSKHHFVGSKDEQVNLENVKPPKKHNKIKYIK